MAGVRSADRGRRTQGRYGAPRGGSGFATHGQEPARGGRRRSSRAKFRRVFPRVSVLRIDFEVQLATRSREAPRRVVRSSDQHTRRGSLDHVFRAPGDGLVVSPRECPFAVGIARASGFERRPSVTRAGSGEAARTLGWFELARRRPARFARAGEEPQARSLAGQRKTRYPTSRGLSSMTTHGSATRHPARGWRKRQPAKVAKLVN